MFYVYEPNKTRPNSQRHGERWYGDFYTVENAQKWIDERGLGIITNVKIVSAEEMTANKNKKYKLVLVAEEYR